VHTFVIGKKFFIHLSLIPVLGVQSRAFTLEDGLKGKSNLQVASTAEARLVLGYNGPRYYGGLSAAANAFSDNTDTGGVLGQNISYFRLFFGRRFRLPFRLPIVDHQ